MRTELRLTVVAVFSFAAAAALVPLAIRVSYRTGFVDRPEGWKSHLRPTPVLGGAAVVLAVCVGIWAGSNEIARLTPIVLGMLGLSMLGTIDDRAPLKVRHKLPFEIGAGVLLWSTGLGWQLGSEPVNFAITVAWVVAVINATNLFDLVDGLATAVTLVIAAACAALALIGGDVAVACASLAMVGACLGFLPFNIASPSRIFLGDGGTIPLGFASAALTMLAIDSATGGLAGLAVGMALLGVPLVDMAQRIVGRLRRRVSILTAGPDSVASALTTRLPSGPAVALLVGAGQATLSVAAIVSVELLGSTAAIVGSLSLATTAVWLLLIALRQPAPSAAGGPSVSPGAAGAASADG